jgi:hypothetical protein
VFLVAALLAGSAPMFARDVPAAGRDRFPGWPATFEGRPLTALPMTAREEIFGGKFPGRVGRFSDGEREIILRWIAAPTRLLHPSSSCFRAIGYKITPRPMRMAENGKPMSCFRADGKADAFEVCEQVTASGGGSYADVPTWYWHAFWAGRGETWWSTVVAAPIARDK